MNYNYQHALPAEYPTVASPGFSAGVLKQSRASGRLLVAIVLICTTPIVAAQSPHDHSVRFAAELENIRALPFGFAAVCEEDDLKIRSDKSATFIVRDSLLCAFRKTDIAVERRGYFILCNNNPELEIDSGNTPIAKCYELNFSATEI